MKAQHLAVAAVLVVSACGVDVPAGLDDKLKKACAGAVKAEPVAVITRGFEISDVSGEFPTMPRMGKCTVQVKDGSGSRDALSVILSLKIPAVTEAELCKKPARVPELISGPDGSCGYFRGEPGNVAESGFMVKGFAGVFEARIMVTGVPAASEEDGQEAAFQILTDLRASDVAKDVS